MKKLFTPILAALRHFLGLFHPPTIAYALKESGIGMTVTVDDSSGSGQALTNDITSINWSTPRGVQDITGLDKSGIERLLLLGDGQLSMSGVFNDDANKSLAVLKTGISSNVTRTVVIVVSGQTLTMEMVISDFAMTRAQDGSFTWTATLQLCNGTVPAWT